MKNLKSGILNLVSLYHLKLIIMFGIGGGEFYIVYCANAFGSDKVPARAMVRLWRN
jgi:hypothetical protein